MSDINWRQRSTGGLAGVRAGARGPSLYDMYAGLGPDVRALVISFFFCCKKKIWFFFQEMFGKELESTVQRVT